MMNCNKLSYRRRAFLVKSVTGIFGNYRNQRHISHRLRRFPRSHFDSENLAELFKISNIFRRQTPNRELDHASCIISIASVVKRPLKWLFLFLNRGPFCSIWKFILHPRLHPEFSQLKHRKIWKAKAPLSVINNSIDFIFYSFHLLN